MEVNSPPSSLRCSPLEFAGLLYLCVPLLIFFLTFTAYAISAAAAVTIVVVLYRLRPRRPIEIDPRWRECAAIAFVFLACCGYLLSYRSWDWIKHFAIINELGEHPWPPVRSDTNTFLRYYLGYYLVPGLYVKFLGHRLLNSFLLVYTWIGLSLALALLLQKLSPKRPVIFVVVFLLFSGLDLIPAFFLIPDFTIFVHKEWWAGLGWYSYQGHATLFLWVPQHALAGLLGLAIVLPPRGGTAPPAIVAILLVAVLFWSPFAALGLAPFVLAMTYGAWRETAFDWGNILCGLVLGVPVLAYLLAGTGGVPHGLNWKGGGSALALLATFLMVEVGVYLIALRLCCWQFLRYPWVVIGVLLLLPLYHLGLFNDLTMRTCIPAVALIAMAVAHALSNARGYAWIPLACLVAIGSATSILEMIGRTSEGRVHSPEIDLRSGPLSTNKNYFVQYNAPLPHWVLRR